MLHSRWLRNVTAGALRVGRPAFGYFAWQAGDDQQLKSLLDSSLREPRYLGPGRSLFEAPAQILALQRSSIGQQSLTFAVFRDRPKAGWPEGTRKVIDVELDPSELVPVEEVGDVVSIYLGIDHDAELIAVGSHPITRVLGTCREMSVREVQFPVPDPFLSKRDLVWARVQVVLREGDARLLPAMLTALHKLANPGTGIAGIGSAERPLIAVQSTPEGRVRCLNAMAEEITTFTGPANEDWESGRLIHASDLDLVSGRFPAAGGRR